MTRVAKVGSLSARAKMVIKTFVKHVFTMFATIFLRVIANQYNMIYITCNRKLLAKVALFLSKKGTFPKSAYKS